MSVVVGAIYRHWKRRTLYRVEELGTFQRSRDSADLDGANVVIYRSVNEPSKVYVRTVADFEAIIESKEARFERVGWREMSDEEREHVAWLHDVVAPAALERRATFAD